MIDATLRHAGFLSPGRYNTLDTLFSFSCRFRFLMSPLIGAMFSRLPMLRQFRGCRHTIRCILARHATLLFSPLRLPSPCYAAIDCVALFATVTFSDFHLPYHHADIFFSLRYHWLLFRRHYDMAGMPIPYRFRYFQMPSLPFVAIML